MKKENKKKIEEIVLPNQKNIYCINKGEVEFLYNEIFVKEMYFKYGIGISSENPIVLDIGANIGMFSLYVLNKKPLAKIIAVEPIPPTFEVLRRNLKDFKSVETLNKGISDKGGSAEFCYFPSVSTDSVQLKFRDNHEQDIQLGFENFYKDKISNNLKRERFIKHLMSTKMLNEQIYKCELFSISDIVEKYNLRHIDLIKIDVEKSEFEALNGIKEEHWGIIDQIVMEVHNLSSKELIELKRIFEVHGFDIEIDLYEELEIPCYYNVYAKKAKLLK